MGLSLGAATGWHQPSDIFNLRHDLWHEIGFIRAGDARAIPLEPKAPHDILIPTRRPFREPFPVAALENRAGLSLHSYRSETRKGWLETTLARLQAGIGPLPMQRSTGSPSL
jgi:hypothetical protein